MESGKYRNKKSINQMVLENIEKRGLTSYMNNTKWREFQNAMENDMPFPPPYIYKTVFDDAKSSYFDFSEDCSYTDSYDRESFAWNDYSVIEWVKVRPRYYHVEGGCLVQKKIFHDAEKEFVKILKKYAIPYEAQNGLYTIYGYK